MSHTGKPYVTNALYTTKYNFITFIPWTLLLQFTKFANCFYLVSAILQSIPSISTNDPLATVIPLCYIVLLGMLKEGLADYKRYKNDKKDNSTATTRLVLNEGSGPSEPCQWREIDSRAD